MAEEERSARLQQICDAVFPDSLSGVQNTYLSESGRVELAVSRMTPEMESILKETVVRGRSLHQMFTDWVDAGRTLGELERERIRFSEKEEANVITAKDVQLARFRWIRTMNALVAVLELDENLPENLRLHILQPLRTAEAKQNRRRVKNTATDDENDTETPLASGAEASA